MRLGTHGLIVRLTSGGIVLGALVTGPAAVAAEPADTPVSPAIVVRVYAQGETAGEVVAGRGTTSAILNRAGIDVVWVDCGGSPAPAAMPAACATPAGWNEVFLRIVTDAPDTRPTGIGPLGYAHVDVQAGAGLLATIYVDRVSALAISARVEASDVLARAIAHEIGHLLLGTNSHARRGLMRAAWSPSDLKGNLPVQWLFSKAEGTAMRRSLTARRALTGAGFP
jgi:hypothetical protein